MWGYYFRVMTVWILINETADTTVPLLTTSVLHVASHVRAAVLVLLLLM
jgi:hypothetical protein